MAACGGQSQSASQPAIGTTGGGTSGSGGSGGSGGGQGAPPATVLDNVEDSTVWLTCGNCGNTGATGATAQYSFTPDIAAPSEDGASTEFSLMPTAPFTNAYWYREHTPITTQINALTYEFDLYIPAGSENAPQAIEFECQQTLNGWVYNFAWQAVYAGTPQWRIFDYGLRQWQPAGISLAKFTPGTWHHIVAEYHNDVTSHTVVHDALTVDGVRNVVGITHNAFFSGKGNQFTNAFQLDANSQGVAYSTYVDHMKITYQ